MRGALGRLADWTSAHGIEAPGPYRAARDLVLRHLPRITGVEAGASLDDAGEDVGLVARRLALRLDATTLPIQGPPGTGKTWTGARMILDLVREGRRVGVTAQSHKVIANMLEAVVDAAAEEAREVRIAQRCDGGQGSDDPRIPCVSNDAARGGLADGTYQLVGGTAWLWAREDMASSIEVLFVDEAGQMALSTVCATAGAADSIVLLGDPNQLPQVSQGTHPEGAAASALEHLVGEAKTIEPARGLLLSTTYRLHPDVNAFISDTFYEGRLEPATGNERQSIAAGEPVGGVGIRQVELATRGASNRSHDEADWIAKAIERLLGRRWTDREGGMRPLTVEDILVVAPYNAQVAEIAATIGVRLGVRPNVGTVDRFQGREAPVAIYSMTTSTPEEAPRDMEFLYSGNRLNVAMSRARGLAVLVMNPALLAVACRSPEQMRLVNAFCRFVEIAAEQGAAGSEGPRELSDEPPVLLNLGL
jgi:uncharacterized protein